MDEEDRKRANYLMEAGVRFATYEGFPVIEKGKKVRTLWISQEIDGSEVIDLEYHDEESAAMDNAMQHSEDHKIEYVSGGMTKEVGLEFQGEKMTPANLQGEWLDIDMPDKNSLAYKWLEELIERGEELYNDFKEEYEDEFNESTAYEILGDQLSETADLAVPILTYKKWVIWTELGGWKYDSNILEGQTMYYSEINDIASTILYEIAQQGIFFIIERRLED